MVLISLELLLQVREVLPFDLFPLPKFALLLLDLRFVEHVFFFQDVVLLLLLTLLVMQRVYDVLLHV